MRLHEPDGTTRRLDVGEFFVHFTYRKARVILKMRTCTVRRRLTQYGAFTRQGPRPTSGALYFKGMPKMVELGKGRSTENYPNGIYNRCNSEFSCAGTKEKRWSEYSRIHDGAPRGISRGRRRLRIPPKHWLLAGDRHCNNRSSRFPRARDPAL